jgi:hypothetical protein
LRREHCTTFQHNTVLKLGSHKDKGSFDRY